MVTIPIAVRMVAPVGWAALPMAIAAGGSLPLRRHTLAAAWAGPRMVAAARAALPLRGLAAAGAGPWMVTTARTARTLRGLTAAGAGPWMVATARTARTLRGLAAARAGPWMVATARAARTLRGLAALLLMVIAVSLSLPRVIIAAILPVLRQGRRTGQGEPGHQGEGAQACEGSHLVIPFRSHGGDRAGRRRNRARETAGSWHEDLR
ncbi:hypothetical protein [Acidocella sp.]|uniref:hypothetical protein n=1 Tax=Acidocella sp. TaxID=50710 RepID=UPI00260AB93F|nr:hypothetical protein [Acidocella sp.]